MGRPRIYIVEGIPGSGKDTYARDLLRRLGRDRQPVYYYPEDALLRSWLHLELPGTDELAITLMERLVERVEDELALCPAVVFVFNRFHLSFALTSHTPGLDDRYHALVERLRRLDVLVIISVLRPPELWRVRHPEREREQLAWRFFRQRRLAQLGATSPEAVYAEQQVRFLHLAGEQGLPYQVEHVRLPLGVRWQLLLAKLRQRLPAPHGRTTPANAHPQEEAGLGIRHSP